MDAGSIFNIALFGSAALIGGLATLRNVIKTTKFNNFKRRLVSEDEALYEVLYDILRYAAEDPSNKFAQKTKFVARYNLLSLKNGKEQSLCEIAAPEFMISRDLVTLRFKDSYSMTLWRVHLLYMEREGRRKILVLTRYPEYFDWFVERFLCDDFDVHDLIVVNAELRNETVKV